MRQNRDVQNGFEDYAYQLVYVASDKSITPIGILAVGAAEFRELARDASANNFLERRGRRMGEYKIMPVCARDAAEEAATAIKKASSYSL